jgi:TolB protein
MNKHTVKAACVAAAALITLTGCGAGQAPAAGTPAAATTAATTTSSAPTRPAGITGTLYYSSPEAKQALGRLSGDRLVSVIPADKTGVAVVSPDGSKVVYVNESTLWLTDGAGANGRKLGTGFRDYGFEPVWSPTGDRLLVAKGKAEADTATLGIVTIATGAFTPLAHNPGGIHYVWSGDGKHLGYATGNCHLGISDADGGNARVIPDVVSCDPFSLSADGTKMAVDVIHPGDDAGDIAPNMTVDAVIDTTTGKAVAVPVTGEVCQLLFRADGSMLVRARTGKSVTLTLLGADGTVIGTTTEPAAIDPHHLLVALVAYV